MSTRTHTTKPTRAEAGQRPAAPRPRTGGFDANTGKPLSLRQIKAINVLAGKAYDFLESIGGLTPDPNARPSRTAQLTAWRHKEQFAAVKIESLKDCGNNHYRQLKAHFLTLAGKDAAAFGIYVRTGRVKDHGATEDTHENRETFRKKIFDALVEHGHRVDPRRKEFNQKIADHVAANKGLITGPYVVAIAKNKCKGRALDSLTATELQQILYTVVNRISTREGRRDLGRNSKQRKSS